MLTYLNKKQLFCVKTIVKTDTVPFIYLRDFANPDFRFLFFFVLLSFHQEHSCWGMYDNWLQAWMGWLHTQLLKKHTATCQVVCSASLENTGWENIRCVRCWQFTQLLRKQWAAVFTVSRRPGKYLLCSPPGSFVRVFAPASKTSRVMCPGQRMNEHEAAPALKIS